MDTLVLQGKIENLLSSVSNLLLIGNHIGYIYADEFSDLNHDIHNQINELYPLRGNTVEQDANLCLAILMGYSISVYANPEDEFKKRKVLVRSQRLLQTLSPSFLQRQLSSTYNELLYQLNEAYY